MINFLKYLIYIVVIIAIIAIAICAYLFAQAIISDNTKWFISNSIEPISIDKSSTPNYAIDNNCATINYRVSKIVFHTTCFISLVILMGLTLNLIYKYIIMDIKINYITNKYDSIYKRIDEECRKIKTVSKEVYNNNTKEISNNNIRVHSEETIAEDTVKELYKIYTSAIMEI